MLTSVVVAKVVIGDVNGHLWDRCCCSTTKEHVDQTFFNKDQKTQPSNASSDTTGWNILKQLSIFHRYSLATISLGITKIW